MEKTIRVAERLTFNEWWDSLPASRISSKQLAQDAWNAALHQLPLDDDARRTRGGERCEALLHKAKDHTIQWLAEHPADDAEPITEEWLRSIGFKEKSGWFGLWVGSLRWLKFKGRPGSCITFGEQRLMDGEGVTRGRLRLLMRALAIPAPGEQCGADGKGGGE